MGAHLADYLHRQRAEHPEEQAEGHWHRDWSALGQLAAHDAGLR
jgi:hypothetical protein